ncbi:MAG: hypothetical protein KGN37_01265 [Burkholderiales bacterium]|nr:hypothetical protein [Burkholderiales bacterium]
MRTQELMLPGLRLLAVYTDLAQRGAHLLEGILKGQPPRQWAHYPPDDAMSASGFQWFYHSHDPLDRAGAAEHGHLHIFARRPLWARRLRSRDQRAFESLCGQVHANADTRHLLAIGLDAKGVPITLFTVNSWVTGDAMLNAPLTLDLLRTMSLDTGYTEVDAVMESLVQLCQPELHQLLQLRDHTLAAWHRADKLHDTELEVLSEIRIDLDAKLSGGG